MSICHQRRCTNVVPANSRSHRRYCSPSCRAMEARNRQREALALFARANEARTAGRTDEAQLLDREAASVLASTFQPAGQRRTR